MGLPKESLSITTGVAILFTLAITGAALGADDSSKETLRGLRGVKVIVEEVDPEVSSYVLTSDVKTQVELKLREGNVRLFSSEESDADANSAGLIVSVTALPMNDEKIVVAVMVSFELGQTLWRLKRGTATIERPMFGVTWESNRLHIFGRDRLRDGALQRALARMADQFINDWQATHPQQKTP